MTGGRIDVRCNLDAPHASPEPALHSILQTSLRRALGKDLPSPSASGPLWGVEQFSLERMTAFTAALPQARAAMLRDLQHHALAEALYVEKAGLAFAAKMSLLAETTEERMLYSLFGADEAAHYALLAPYLEASSDAAAGQPFLGLVVELIEAGTREELLLCVQVLLEGWGLKHYRALAAGCLDAGLRAVFARILADEGRHHRCGVAASDPAKLGPEDREALTELLGRFFVMAQVGPQTTVAVVSRHCGGLTRAQRLRAFEELDTEAVTARQLSSLDAMIGKVRQAGALRDALQRRGFLTPWSAARCAAMSA